MCVPRGRPGPHGSTSVPVAAIPQRRTGDADAGVTDLARASPGRSRRAASRPPTRAPPRSPSSSTSGSADGTATRRPLRDGAIAQSDRRLGRRVGGRAGRARPCRSRPRRRGTRRRTRPRHHRSAPRARDVPAGCGTDRGAGSGGSRVSVQPRMPGRLRRVQRRPSTRVASRAVSGRRAVAGRRDQRRAHVVKPRRRRLAGGGPRRRAGACSTRESKPSPGWRAAGDAAPAGATEPAGSGSTESGPAQVGAEAHQQIGERDLDRAGLGARPAQRRRLREVAPFGSVAREQRSEHLAHRTAVHRVVRVTRDAAGTPGTR